MRNFIPMKTVKHIVSTVMSLTVIAGCENGMGKSENEPHIHLGFSWVDEKGFGVLISTGECPDVFESCSVALIKSINNGDDPS